MDQIYLLGRGGDGGDGNVKMSGSIRQENDQPSTAKENVVRSFNCYALSLLPLPSAVDNSKIGHHHFTQTSKLFVDIVLMRNICEGSEPTNSTSMLTIKYNPWPSIII